MDKYDWTDANAWYAEQVINVLQPRIRSFHGTVNDMPKEEPKPQGRKIDIPETPQPEKSPEPIPEKEDHSANGTQEVDDLPF